MSDWDDKFASIRLGQPPAFDLVKGKLAATSPSRAPRSYQENPMDVQAQMGFKDRRYSISFDLLRTIPQQLSIVAAIIQTRCNQIATFAKPYRENNGVGFRITHKDKHRERTRGENEFIRNAENFIRNCGQKAHNKLSDTPRDHFEIFLKKIIRDSLILDQLCFEIVPDKKGRPYEFLAVDAATIRIYHESYHNQSSYGGNYISASKVGGNMTSDISIQPINSIGVKSYDTLNENAPFFKRPAYVQLLDGKVENVYNREELAFCIRNHRTDLQVMGYGLSEIEMLINNITAHLNAESYNAVFFQQGCVAGDTPVVTDKGTFLIKDLLINKSLDFIPSGNCWNGQEWVPFDVVSTGDKIAVITTLSDGASITTSPDHKFLTLNEEGELEMVPISELSPGSPVPESREKTDSILIPNEGILVSSGYSNTIGFSTAHKDNGIGNTEYISRFAGGSVPSQLQIAICKKVLKAETFNTLTNSTKMMVKRVVSPGSYAAFPSSFSRKALLQLCDTFGITGFEEALSYRWKTISSIEHTVEKIPMFDVRQDHPKHQWSCGHTILTNSSPRGILNFKGDAMAPDQLETFKRMWRNELEGVKGAWRTPITQSEAGIDWINLHTNNRDMEYGSYLEYLLKVSCAVFQIDPAELNFDMAGGVQQTPLFESSQEWKLKASRDKGLRPLLNFISDTINTHIISRLDDSYTFEFIGLDEPTEKEKHDMRKEQIASYLTPNEVRRMDDRPDIPYGDVLLNPAYIQLLALKQQESAASAGAAGAGGPSSAESGAAPTGDAPAAGQPHESEDDDTNDHIPEYADSFGGQ